MIQKGFHKRRYLRQGHGIVGFTWRIKKHYLNLALTYLRKKLFNERIVSRSIKETKIQH